MRSDDLGGPGASAAPAPGDAPGEPTTAAARLPGWRRLLPAVVIPLLLVLLAGILFAVDRSGPAVAGGAAARFLPADGQSARYVDAEGRVDAVEHARLIGVEGIFTAPDVVASSVLAATGEAGVTAAQLWRETLTTADGSQYSDLYLVDAHGISEVAAWGGPVGFTFAPALLVLPADAVAGDEWSSSGSAFGDGALTYRAEYRASAPPAVLQTPDGRDLEIAPDCLQVEGTLLVEQPGSGPLLDSTGASIWCPGQGRVHTAGEQNGQPVASALAGPAAELSDAASAEPGTPEEGTLTAQPGDVTPLDAVAVDPFFGESVKQGAVTVSPAVTGDGLTLVANDRGDDLHAWRLGEARATLEWVAHPGGVIVAVAAAGDLALAATSERAVHAYDALGRRLWTWRGAELALAAPVDAPGHGPLIATRDGRVTLLRAADGAEDWSVDLGADTRGSILVAGDVVVAADERGRVSGIDAGTGELRWRQDIGMVEAMTVSGDGAGLYIATFDNDVARLDPATGESVWDDGFVGILGSLIATPDGVVVGTDEQTVGYSAEGAEAWTAAGSDQLRLVGRAAVEGGTLSAEGRTVTLRSSDGEAAGEWRLPGDATLDEGHVVASGNDLILVDSFLRFWRMEGR